MNLCESSDTNQPQLGSTYPNPNITRLAVAGMQKLIIEALEVTVNKSVMNLLAKQLEVEITSKGAVKFNAYSASLMLLHKRSNEIYNPADLLTLKDAINRLDFRH